MNEFCDDVYSKKMYIKNKVDYLTYKDRLYVLQILKQHIPSKIIENADGCRINLDKLDSFVIEKIHHIISSRINIPNILII